MQALRHYGCRGLIADKMLELTIDASHVAYGGRRVPGTYSRVHSAKDNSTLSIREASNGLGLTNSVQTKIAPVRHRATFVSFPQYNIYMYLSSLRGNLIRRQLLNISR